MVGAGFNVVRLVVAAEAAQQRAVFREPVAHLQVVVRTAVVSLNLKGPRRWFGIVRNKPQTESKFDLGEIKRK